MAYCILIRHGRSTANSRGILAGRLPGIGLDETGREQAAALPDRLAGTPFVHLVSSPLQRCLETAQPLAAAHGLTVHEHEGIAECRYGAWTGRLLTELTEEPLWRTVQERPSEAAFPGSDEHEGESIAQMAARAVSAVTEIDATVTAEHGEHAVWGLVSHGDIIKSVLAAAVATPLDDFQRLHVDPSSISVVQYTRSRPMLLRSNDTGSSALRPPAPTEEASSGDATVGGGSGLGSRA